MSDTTVYTVPISAEYEAAIDAEQDFEAFVRQEVGKALGEMYDDYFAQLEAEILNGDGVGKPKGIIKP